MIWLLIPGWLKRAVAWAAVGLAAIAGIFMAGKREARQAAKTERLEADRRANERINDADVSRGDADSDTDWLRHRSGK